MTSTHAWHAELGHSLTWNECMHNDTHPTLTETRRNPWTTSTTRDGQLYCEDVPVADLAATVRHAALPLQPGRDRGHT